MKYRQNIDATQWFPGSNIPEIASDMKMGDDGTFIVDSFGSIKTGQGIIKVNPGDWIVRSAQGIQIVTPENFAKAFEKAEDPKEKTP